MRVANWQDKREQGATARGYGHKWQVARANYLRAHPLCRMCEQENRLTAATIVDHVVPHRGDAGLFWDVANWQPLCAPHHDGAKQAEEKGAVRGCDANGLPIAKAHHWNK